MTQGFPSESSRDDKSDANAGRSSARGCPCFPPQLGVRGGYMCSRHATVGFLVLVCIREGLKQVFAFRLYSYFYCFSWRPRSPDTSLPCFPSQPLSSKSVLSIYSRKWLARIQKYKMTSSVVGYHIEMPANARLRSSGFVAWEFFFVFVASGALRKCNATPQSSVGP